MTLVNDYTLACMGVEKWVVYSLKVALNAPNQAKNGQNLPLALLVNQVVHIQ